MRDADEDEDADADAFSHLNVKMEGLCGTEVNPQGGGGGY